MNQAVADEKAARFEKSIQRPTFSPPIKIGLGIVVIVFLAIGFYTSSLWHKEDLAKTSSDADTEAIQDRQPIIDFELTDEAGNKTPFANLKGKVVLLSFWASWCQPCLVEFPIFASIEKRFADRGFVVVPINVDEGDLGKTFSRDFWAKNNFSFKNYYDPERNLAERFEIDVLPANFVVDRQGRIVFSNFGATDWTDPETVDLIEGLLNEK